MSKPFKYRPTYVAAWPDRESEDRLYALGVRRRVHLTTFHDDYGQMTSLTPYPWDEVKAARIASVVEWSVGGQLRLVALMESNGPGCDWSQAINDHFHAQGVREDLPHSAHMVLAEPVEAGTAAGFQALVGMVIFFNRHGGEDASLSKYLEAPRPAAAHLVPTELDELDAISGGQFRYDTFGQPGKIGVRATHTPSGLYADAYDEQTLHQKKLAAAKKLTAILEAEKTAQAAAGEVRLEFITDLADIPDAQVEEFASTIPALIAMMKLTRKECAASGVTLKSVMPVVRFVANAENTFALTHKQKTTKYNGTDVVAAAKRIST